MLKYSSPIPRIWLLDWNPICSFQLSVCSCVNQLNSFILNHSRNVLDSIFVSWNIWLYSPKFSESLCPILDFLSLERSFIRLLYPELSLNDPVGIGGGRGSGQPVASEIQKVLAFNPFRIRSWIDWIRIRPFRKSMALIFEGNSASVAYLRTYMKGNRSFRRKKIGCLTALHLIK